MRNSLQEQLLKAGLIDKNKAKAVVREQGKAQKQGKALPEAGEGRQLLAVKAERDRALALAQNEQKRRAEAQAQIRQIIAHYKQARSGEIAYQFSDGGKIRNLLVNERLRAQIAKGQLVITALDAVYELVPRAAAEMIRLRDAEVIVVDHRSAAALAPAQDEDDPYKDFPVPDDLVW